MNRSTFDLIIFGEELERINTCLSKLCADAKGKAIFLVDKNGQLISSCGETEGLDTTSLASLTAGNIAASGGLARLLGEREFSILFHEGERDNLHISLVGELAILVILFDRRSSLGLVRLRAKRATEDLGQIFDNLLERMEQEKGRAKALFLSHFGEVTDADIDNLFRSRG